MRFVRKILASLSVAMACAAATGDLRAQEVLRDVRERGYVKCAIGNQNVGVTRIGESGYEGFFPEFCRVVALAVIGDRKAVQLSPTIIRYGLQSVSEGDVDVYISNVTWTFSRDIKLNLTPAAVLYYDGQGFMSQKGRVRGALDKLEKARVCVSRSTTTIANLQDYIALHKLAWEVLPFESSQGRNEAFFSHLCDLLTTDRLVLASLRANTVEDPDNYVLHDEVISKEPLVAYVSTRDMLWANVVRWAVYATVLAEEKGITKANYRAHLKSPDPVVRRLLGIEPVSGNETAGLAPDWARKVIAGAGNYGEIFERHLGSGSKMNVPRGMNRLWRDGGLLISPPFR
jgi:general L-amino acid transport system substrate-binding protein